MNRKLINEAKRRMASQLAGELEPDTTLFSTLVRHAEGEGFTFEVADEALHQIRLAVSRMASPGGKYRRRTPRQPGGDDE